MARTEDSEPGSYRETGAGGYTSVDGTVEFYGRINALLAPSDMVLDFGAGRAAWLEEDKSPWRRSLRNLKGKVDKVIACDIDPAVKDNTTADDTVVLTKDSDLPFPAESFDVIVADYVFEHLDDPAATGEELARVLKPGGWICARTPNRWGYISIATRAIPNARHAKVLGRAQPRRQEQDVFPTRFRLNTMKEIESAFPTTSFANYSYYYEAEPAYYFGRRSLFILMRMLNSILPSRLRSNIFVFVQKRVQT